MDKGFRRFSYHMLLYSSHTLRIFISEGWVLYPRIIRKAKLVISNTGIGIN